LLGRLRRRLHLPRGQERAHVDDRHQGRRGDVGYRRDHVQLRDQLEGAEMVRPSKRSVNDRCDDDAGVSIVIVALSVVALLLFSALAIDGGRAYAQRRVTQNAADAAAMAGARAVQQARFKVSSPPPPSSIETAVESALAENDAEPVECYL